MGIGTRFGIVTKTDIDIELASRGIMVREGGAITETVVVSPGIVVPTTSPESPITVLPRGEIDTYEPFIPIYPPAVVSPEDVTPEEILPYIPGTGTPEAEKGLDKGLLVIIAITAFALMALAKPKPEQRSDPTRRRRF